MTYKINVVVYIKGLVVCIEYIAISTTGVAWSII